jgi:transposase
VISSGARRRWTLEEKQRIVAESYAGSRLVSATARRYRLSASQLFTWRRQALDGRLVDADEIVRFASAVVDDNGSLRSQSSLPEFAAAAVNLSAQACPTVAPGRIEIVLVGGHRVFVDSGVDTTVLSRILAMLDRP